LENLKEVLSILQYALELKKELGASATDRIDYLKIIHACFLEPGILTKIEDLIELVEATEDIITFCKKYPNTAKLNNIRLDSFNTIISNKLVGLEEVELARQLRLLDLKQRITRSFQEIPQIDYVKQNKSLEELVTAEMTYVMDNRVIDFYENNKSTARSLREIIKGKQKFPKKEFEKLKEAFPCILAGIRDYADYIPLERELFDVLIIDEASQVSIAQAFPALLRAKKVVIFGDRKQFSNVKAAHARSDSNREYLTRLRDVFKTHISTDPTEIVRLGKFNIKTSILEFFEFIASYNAQLAKHFRGYKELISYSNKYFYKNSLQVMKIRGKPINEVLKFATIEHDGKIEPIPNTNLLEIQFIISELNKIKEDKSSVTVGIITPHTNQQKMIMDEIRRLKDSDYYFDNLKLKIMTFDTCQGEERDIIFYSMVAVKDMDRLWGVFIKDLRSIDIEEDGAIKAQRLNVGFSRARETIHFVISKPLDEYNGSIGEALRHYSSVLEDAQKERSSEDVDKSSPKEKEVLHWFYQTEFWNKNKNRIDFIPQFKIGQYLKQLDITYTHPNYVVDFLLIYKEPKTKKEHKIVIEYDGFQEHFANIANVDSYNYREYYTSEDVYRQKILMGYGYKFLRINKFNIGDSPVETLNNRIESLVTGKAEKTDFLQDIHNTVEEIQTGTKKECPRCSSLKGIDDFKDSSLISGISRYCKECKANKKAQKKPSYTTINEKHLLLVQQAIKHNRTLDIVYKGRYRSKTYRKIKPLRITGTLVRAYCYLRRSERTFNITRMKIQVP
jgi:very-short-patch-repair endonuclease